jgi:hypothetical protein
MTAMSTAKSGYIQRKIVKVCEDIQVAYDHTVRDTSGKIYEFAYGENGYDATKTVPVCGEPQICDVSRLVRRLNAIVEEGLDEDILEDEDSLEIVEMPVQSQNPENIKIVERILEMSPYSLVDETWTTEELRQRLSDLENEEEKKQEKEHLEEKYQEDDDDISSEDEDEDGTQLVVEEEEEEEDGKEEESDDESDFVMDDYEEGDDVEVGGGNYYGDD